MPSWNSEFTLEGEPAGQAAGRVAGTAVAELECDGFRDDAAVARHLQRDEVSGMGCSTDTQQIYNFFFGNELMFL